MIWAINLITQAKNTGKIKLDPPILASLQSGFENIEAQNRKLLNYSWVNYPLPYTQVIQNYKSQGISYDQLKLSFYLITIIILIITDCYVGRVLSFSVGIV